MATLQIGNKILLDQATLPDTDRGISRAGDVTAVGEWRMSAWGDKYLYANYFLQNDHYEAIRDASLAVKELLGEEALIGVGRSPSSMTTMLNNFKDGGAVINLPLSDFRFHPNGDIEQPPSPYDNPRTIDHFRALSDVESEKLFSHFDNTLGSFIRNQSGRINLIDICESAASLFATARYLELYAEERGLDLEFRAIVVTKEMFSPIVDRMATYYDLEPIKVVLHENRYVDGVLESETCGEWKRSEYGKMTIDAIMGRTYISVPDPFGGPPHIADVECGEPVESFPFFRTAVRMSMQLDKSLDPTNLCEPPIDVTGLLWDPSERCYRDDSGKQVVLKTS